MNPRGFLEKYFLIILCASLVLIALFTDASAQEKAGQRKQKEDVSLMQLQLTCAQEAAKLKEKVKSLEQEKAILEAMLKEQPAGLRQPGLTKAEQENIDKDIHLNLGFAYGQKGKIADAITEYAEALKYAPADFDIHYNLGFLYAKQKKYKEAVAEYKQSLSGVAQDKETYYNLAIIYAIGLKDQKTAQEYYSKSIESSDASRATTSQNAFR